MERLDGRKGFGGERQEGGRLGCHVGEVRWRERGVPAEGKKIVRGSGNCFEILWRDSSSFLE